MATTSVFKVIYSDNRMRDNFYRFLQVIFHLYPEDKFHQLIVTTTAEKKTDEDIYKTVQGKLKTIKPFLSELTYSLPALKKQKKEIAGQVLSLLGSKTNIDGYLEIGSTGRYISELRKHIKLTGGLYITNDIAPTNSIADIFERGQLGKIGTFFSLADYAPISSSVIADSSIDLVTCNIGLHHCTDALMGDYIDSIKRILRPGGFFIIRDHNVNTDELANFVSLAHTVFNLGLNIPWETDAAEYKSFKTTDQWSSIITARGFTDKGARILQDNDPTDNTLMAFIKN